MRISSVWYSFRQGIKNIRRNILFSLASIGTIVACLFLFGLFYAMIVNFSAAMKSIESNVTISVFFDEGLDSERKDLIGEQIKTRPEVDTLDFISAEDAWKTFSEANYDDPEAARAAFGDDNPLKDSESYSISLNDVSRQADFVNFVQGIDGVRKVVSSEYTADNLSALNTLFNIVSICIIGILSLVSVFLISNTITISFTVRREEIKIMKLIGATNAFTRAPFIVEGIVIGLIGSIIPVIMLYYIYKMALDYVVGRFAILQNVFAFIPPRDLFMTLVPISLAIGVGIGFIGSWATTRKHLKV